MLIIETILKHLAKLLYNLEYFKQYNFSYIYKILVWIALRILIDSKKTTLVGYDEYIENVYDQLLYLFNAYIGVLRLQEAKILIKLL